MRLYRGISVPIETADRVAKDISSRGLASGQGQWQIEVAYPGPLDELFDMEGLSTKDTRSSKSYPVVCAYGEMEGAAYYAFRHNRSGQDDTPVLIEFETTEHRAVRIPELQSRLDQKLRGRKARFGNPGRPLPKLFRKASYPAGIDHSGMGAT